MINLYKFVDCRIGLIVFKLICKMEVSRILSKRKIQEIHIQVYSNIYRKYLELNRNVEIGMFTYGSCFAPDFNIGGRRVEIGKYCSFANSIKYLGANHPMESVCMHPLFYNNNLFGFNVEDIERNDIIIGNGVWIGERVIITSGCKKIGNGVIIGAGSVVTKDIPPYAIVVGNPARIIRYRFDEKECSALDITKWWELPPTELMKYYCDFFNLEKFCEDMSIYRNNYKS